MCDHAFRIDDVFYTLSAPLSIDISSDVMLSNAIDLTQCNVMLTDLTKCHQMTNGSIRHYSTEQEATHCNRYVFRQLKKKNECAKKLLHET